MRLISLSVRRPRRAGRARAAADGARAGHHHRAHGHRAGLLGRRPARRAGDRAAHRHRPPSHGDRGARRPLRDRGAPPGRMGDPRRAVGIPPHGPPRRRPRGRPDLGRRREPRPGRARRGDHRHRRSAAGPDPVGRAQLPRRGGRHPRPSAEREELHRPRPPAARGRGAIPIATAGRWSPTAWA